MKIWSNSTLDYSLDGNDDGIEFLFLRGPKSTYISHHSDKKKLIFDFAPIHGYWIRSTSLIWTGRPQHQMDIIGTPLKHINTSDLEAHLDITTSSIFFSSI